jgi:hypothetical protein
MLSACGGGGSSVSPPGPPSITQIVPADRALVISFSPPVTNGGEAIASYTATCRGGMFDSNSATGGASPITVTGLTNGREYACKLAAKNSAGEGTASVEVTATPYTRPDAPSLTSLAAGDGTITAAFSPPAGDGGNAVIDYRLDCNTGASTRSVTGSSSPLKAEGLTNGTTYSCSVTARNAAGESRASAAQPATPRTLPGAPAISSIAADFMALVLNLSPPASDGGAAILNYSAVCLGGGATLTATSTTPRVLVGGMTNGIAYSCTARATNVAGTGSASDPVGGVPRDLPREAQLTSSMDQSARRATVTWRDVFPAGTAYRIETGPPGATLTDRGTVAVAAGNSATLSWSTDVAAPLVIRVFAVRAPPIGDVSLMSSIYEVFVFVAPISPTAPPGIVFDKPEPLTGQVRMSIAGGVTYSWVDWFVDTTSLGTVMHPAGPGNPTGFNFDGVTSGDHLVTARVQTASNSYSDIKRTVRVANVYLYPDARMFDGVYHILADARSASGIASVEARVNGVSLGVLTAPNCPTCESPTRAYRWRLDPATYPSGTYAVVVTAIDKAGVRKSVEFTAEVRYPPTLTLQEPAEFQIVNGKLRLRATARTDRAGGVRTEVKLEQLTVLDTTSENIDADIDLSGIAPRKYLMSVTTRDSAFVPITLERAIIITGDPKRVYVPALTLDPGATPIGSDGSSLIWQGTDGTYRLQAFGGPATSLAESGKAALSNTRAWTTQGGWVYALGKGLDCTVFYCVYEWSPSGARRNLSNDNPHQSVGGVRCVDNDPVVRGNFVLMQGGVCSGGRLTLYDRRSGAFTPIDPPSGTRSIGDADFYETAAGPVVFFVSASYEAATGALASIDVYRHFAGTSTRLGSPGSRNQDPLTNGTIVGWRRTPLNIINNWDGSFELWVADSSGASVRTVGPRLSSWGISERVFFWSEILAVNMWAQVSSQVLKAEYNGSTYTISRALSARYLAATLDQVFYRSDVELFSRWSARDGQSTLMMETVPTDLWAANGMAVFTFGGGRIYRVGVP